MKPTFLFVMSTSIAAACASPYGNLPTAASWRPPATASAQEPQPTPRPSPDDTALAVGLGFTNDPDTRMVGAALDVPFATHWTFGPALQFGVTDDRTLFAPLLQVKRWFPVTSTRDFASRLLPYALAGIGALHLEEETGAGADVDDTGLLLAFGGGVRYALSDKLSVGTHVQFHFLPDDVLDERYYASWEIAQIVVYF